MLTQKEIEELSNWLDTNKVGNMPLEAPVVSPVGRLDPEATVPLGTYTKLSETTRRAQEKKVAKQAQLKRAYKKRAKALPRGRYHPKRKEATKRRQKEQRWINQPRECLVYGYGVWDIPPEVWEEKVGHLWKKYDPLKLTVKRRWERGTHAAPYRIYDIDIYYKDKLVYDGRAELIYDSSKPNELDIQLAHEGEQLFTTERKLLRSYLPQVGLKWADDTLPLNIIVRQ